MRLEKKQIAVALIILFWFGFWTFMNDISNQNASNLDSQRSQSTLEQSANQQKKCQKIRAEGEAIDKKNSELVEEARTLQRTWIIKEMKNLYDLGKISTSEWEIFSNYVATEDGRPKLPLGDIEVIMKKVVSKGYIKPYLPKQVVELGTQAAINPSSSDYLVNYPECLEEIEYGLIKSLAELPPNKGAWANRIENPVNLIP